MLDTALVRSLFRIVERPEKNDRWFMRESKPRHREWTYNATIGATAGAIGGAIRGSIPPVVVALETGVGLDGIRHLSKIMSVASGFLHSVE